MRRNLISQIGFFVLALVIGIGLGYWFFAGPEAHDHAAHTSMAAGETIWTCSMDPQVRQNEPGQCPICGMDLIPLESTQSDDPFVLEMTPAAVKLMQISTTAVGQTVSLTGENRVLTGKIQPDERLAASQVSHVSGRIEKLWVSFTGAAVRKGQKVAEIYSPALQTAQQELLEALTLEAEYPELVEAARQKLRSWKLSEAQIESIISTKKVQATVPIFAEYSGVVQQKRVAVGDYVETGGVLFDLINLSRVWVLFDAYEEDLASLRPGIEVQFQVQAYPGESFTTRISFVDPGIDPETRVASVRGTVANPGGKLKPEMFVQGTLQGGARSEEGMMIPTSAVLWTGKRSVVYVEVPDREVPSYQFREIVLGERWGDYYQVLEGLQAGERVVTQGSFTLDAAAQLNNQASMMNRNVSLKGQPQKQADLESGEDSVTTWEIPVSLQGEISSWVAQYLQIKDALVEGDSLAVRSFASQLLTELQEMDLSSLPPEGQDFWQTQYRTLQSHGTLLAEARELAPQRKQFEYLSNALVSLLRSFPVSEPTYYLQHCPMAFDFNGADWLSTEQEIFNPYFGDEMLHCGSLTDSL